MGAATTAKVAYETASFIKKHWKKILPGVLVVLLLPLFIATSLTVTSSVPAVNEDQMRLYINVAEKVGKDKTVIDWRNLIAIDAVRYKQNFDEVNESNIQELAQRFIKEVKTEKTVTTTDPQTGKEVTTTVTETTYQTKSLDEVMNELGFSDEEKQYCKTYRDVGMSTALSGDDNGNYGGGYLIDGKGNAPLSLSQGEFFQRIINGAIEGHKKYKVCASITLAQGAIESTWGSSGLVSKANNLFGIKAYNWNGPYVEMPTEEVYGGVRQVVIAKFRAYDNWDASVVDHALFLVNNSTYAQHGFFDSDDYISQAYALGRAGYATDPEYAYKLISFIQEYNLQRYDSQ